MASRGDEIAEGRRLLREAPHLVPRSAHFTTAAYVRDGEDHAAFEQGELQGRERRVDADLVAPVPVEQQGARGLRSQGPVRSFVDQIATGHDGHRYAHVVAAAHPEASRGVLGRVVSTEYALLLAHDDLTGRGIDVGDEARGDERGRHDPHVRGDVVGVGGQVDGRGRRTAVDESRVLEEVVAERVLSVVE